MFTRLTPMYAQATGTEGGATTAPAPATTTTVTTPTPTPTAASTGGQEERRFTQADLDTAIKDRLDRAARVASEKSQKDKEAAEAEKLKAQGEFQKLAEERQRRIEQLEAEGRQRDHDALRARVAARHKLPEAFAARLMGDDEAALDADAKELAKLVALPQTETRRAAPGNQSGPNPTNPSPGAVDQQARADMAARRSYPSF